MALKTHEIVPLLKNFFFGGGGMPPNLPSKNSQLRCSRHAALRHVYPKSKNFKVGPPPSLGNPAYAPAVQATCRLVIFGFYVIYYVDCQLDTILCLDLVFGMLFIVYVKPQIVEFVSY